MKISSLHGCLVAALWLVVGAVHSETSINGRFELQQRYFIDDVLSHDYQGQASASANLEIFRDWNGGDDRLEVEIFARADQHDDQRTHFDVRQFLWTHYGDNYEVSAGLGRVFWGVTESRHLVDVINQTDLVENIDEEEKLGQPMLRYQRFSDVGSFELYVLPYFREKTFEGRDGRLNAGLDIDLENPIFDSTDEQRHVDFAARYSNSIAAFDFGLAWFTGTSREPEFVLSMTDHELRALLYYPQLEQIGLDAQLASGDWLFKFEGVNRNFKEQHIKDYRAITVGFERTLVGLAGSAVDLGIIGEYSYESKRTSSFSLFRDDLFIGLRFAFNNIAGSEVLIGVFDDLEYSGSSIALLEANTRVNERLSASLEARRFSASNPLDPLFRLKDHSFVQLSLTYRF